ncbi:MAG TPA: ABC transporter substrate binding protein [Albitalea sp.]
MKRFCVAIAVLAAALSVRSMEALPASVMEGQVGYRIEVLQVTDIAPYQQALDGFLNGLREHGLSADANLIVNRTTIASDVERGGFWNRLWVFLQVRRQALRIAESPPDLVLTIGTSATRYARGVLDDARIPVVFTAVANPLEIGAPSFRDAGPGVTGATLYTDMADSLKVVRQLFPAVHKIGMVHTDDENGVAHVQVATMKAAEAGLAVSSRQVSKNDGIVPSLKELHADGAGVQMFAVPLDTYYGLRDFEPARDLGDFATEHQLPVVAFALAPVPGAALYVGADFATVGALSASQAVKILKRRLKPDVLPILRQDRPTVWVDPQRAAALKLELPAALLERKTDTARGLWEIGAAK